MSTLNVGSLINRSQQYGVWRGQMQYYGHYTPAEILCLIEYGAKMVSYWHKEDLERIRQDHANGVGGLRIFYFTCKKLKGKKRHAPQ